MDVPVVPEPYLVLDRAQTLDAISSIQHWHPGFSTTEDGEFPEPSSATKVELVHDRWPLYTTEYGSLTVRYLNVAFENTIFQQSHYSTHVNPSQFPADAIISIPSDLRIRDLDFVDSASKFNEEDLTSKNYSRFLTQDKCGLVLKHMGAREHDVSQHQDETCDSVALAISVFVNGELQEIEQDSDNQYRIKPGAKLVVEPSKPLQVTSVYKLFACKTDWEGEDFPITEGSLHKMYRMLETSLFRKLELAKDPRLNFVTRRNLEHILSVCSIPVPRVCRHKLPGHESPQETQKTYDFRPSEQLHSPPEPQQTRDIGECQDCQDQNISAKDEPIALTCGDMSGHRIVTSASL